MIKKGKKLINPLGKYSRGSTYRIFAKDISFVDTVAAQNFEYKVWLVLILRSDVCFGETNILMLLLLLHFLDVEHPGQAAREHLRLRVCPSRGLFSIQIYCHLREANARVLSGRP